MSRIGPAEAAKRLKISVKALKLYERMGILRPERNRAGWRSYSAEDIARAARALAFRAMGFGLAQIAALLDARPGEVHAALAAQESHILRRRAALEEALGALRAAMDQTRPPLRLVA